MFLTFLTLLIAIFISAVSAYYSILGLVSIFAAASLPVIIMGGSLEAGKLMAALWLHKNWKRASIQFKLYLVPAILFLMLLTSMGVFGFLSKAHVDQGVPTGNVAAQIELVDTKIETQRENINASRKVLSQMDGAVDQVLARSTGEQGARNANTLRQQQAKDRAKLSDDISKAQTAIATLNEEKSKIRQQLRLAEAEVGPIKYIAQLIYGDNPDANLLERAVSWVIILIVAVFDPLAIVLLLAGDQQWQWAKAERAARRKEKEDAKKANEPGVSIEEYKNLSAAFETNRAHLEIATAQVSSLTAQLHARPTVPVTETVTKTVTPEEHDKSSMSNYDLDLGKFRRLRSVLAEADNVIKFGTEFPDNPVKGQMFLNISTVPTKLYKFNGDKWIQVDKELSDQYIYNDAYIEYLMDKIETGEYDPEMLTPAEQAQIEAKLK